MIRAVSPAAGGASDVIARRIVEQDESSLATSASGAGGDRSSFDRFLRPRSVAIVGASPQRGSARNTLVRVLLKHGFSGSVYPVSPSHNVIEGIKAYPRLSELPEAPDVALIITPAQTVPGIIDECGAKGIRNAIVYSSGFEETENGKDIAIRLADAAGRNGVAVLGPNCQGIWSVRNKTMLTFGSALMHLDSVAHAPIAVISQSGALAGAIGNSLQGSDTGCSYILSVGNETCIDVIDAVEWVIEQDDVRVVALYLEGLKDASRIIAVAQRARECGVHIVALKTGRSEVGQEATASHTGKIASSHAVYADAFEQAGVISVDSLEDALSAVEVLAFLPNPRASGDPKGGISVLSASGGAGALLADHSSELGLPMSTFSSDTAQALERFLPAFARKANPIDLTGQINSDPALFANTCNAVVSDPRTEAVVVQFASSGRRFMQDNAATFKAMAKQVPVVLSFIGETLERDVRRSFRDEGVFLSPGPGPSMRALSLLYERQRISALPKPARRAALPRREAPREWEQLMGFCEASGVRPAPWVVLKPADRAATTCKGLRYPLVVKVLPSESEHKTEADLVKLRVRSPEEVDAHAAAFRAQLGKPAMGVLVQEMADDGVEVVLSCLRRTDFGPILSIGSGGVAIELYRDVTNLVLPVSEEQILAALRKLKLWTLLQGYRGKHAADVDALARAAVRFGDLFLATPELNEFEMNPVIVGTRGQGVATVDALATMH